MNLENSRAWSLRKYIRELEDKMGKLIIVETGTIRNAASQYVIGDGYSTEIIARYIKNSEHKHDFYSVDLDISVCQKYLQNRSLLSYVKLVQSDSINFLQNFGKVDFAYLDSGNDAQLILNEFKLVEGTAKIVVIDDCVPGSHELLKGNLVIPYVKAKGYRFQLTNRQGIIWL